MDSLPLQLFYFMSSLNLLYLWGFWLLFGVLIGLLANAAGLRPAPWGKQSWFYMLCVAMAGASIGGFCGIWLFGGLFATATATWLAVVAVAIPWLYEKLHKRIAQRQQSR